MLSERDVIRRIDQKFRQNISKLSPIEAASLRLMLDSTRKISNLLQTSRYKAKTRNQNVLKSPKPPGQTGQRPFKGIMIDGVRCCRLCKRPIPHRTKDQYRYHMLAVKRRWMQQAAKRYWTRVGYDKFKQTSTDALKRRSIERKLAIFKEECPLAWSKMSRDDIVKLILGYVNPKNGWMHGPIMFRRWVKRNFR